LRETLGLDADARLYPIELETGRGLLCPSLTVLDNGRLYFGAAAEARLGSSSCVSFPHLKVCLACEADGGRPLSDCRAVCQEEGACRGVFVSAGEAKATELATCFIAWVMATARQRVPEDLGELVRCSFTYNVGVPVGQLEEAPSLMEAYLRVLQAAARISTEVQQGMRFDDALRLAREALMMPLEGGNASAAVQLCPEAEAAMISYLVSPDTPEGLYALVDMGAWTTDISIFRLTDLVGEENAGDRTVEYYAACSHRGALNKVDEEVATALRPAPPEPALGRHQAPPTVSVAQIRRRREMADYTGLGGLSNAGQIRSLAELFDLSRKNLAEEILAAFRSVLNDARQKAPDQSHWMEMQHPTRGQPHTYAGKNPRGRVEVYVAGGGSAEQLVWNRIRESTVIRSVQVLQPLGLTARLGMNVEVRFAVAQGLAFPKALWPESFGPSAVPPFPRPKRRQFVEVDEIGYGK